MSLETKSQQLKDLIATYNADWLLGDLSALIHAGRERANDQLGKLSSPQRQLYYLAGLNIGSDPGDGLDVMFTQSKVANFFFGDSKTPAANKSIANSGAGRWSNRLRFAIWLWLQQDIICLAFCFYLHQKFFNWLWLPGGRFSTSPPSAILFRWWQFLNLAMRNPFRYFLGLLFQIVIVQTAHGQKLITFDTTEISRNIEIDLIKTSKRGIEDEIKAAYYVEKDLHTLTAYHNGLKKWTVDIIKKFGSPTVGQAEIRHIKLDKNRIIVTYGKHSYASVNINTGKATFLGSD